MDICSIIKSILVFGIISIIIFACSNGGKTIYNPCNTSSSSSSSSSLGSSGDFLDNITPPSDGITTEYLEELEQFLDDVYDEVEDYSDEDGFDEYGELEDTGSQDVAKCACGCGTLETASVCGCGCGNIDVSTCEAYTGSYNGYFKDAAGNYYFMTKALTHLATTAYGETQIYYVYNEYNDTSALFPHVSIHYPNNIADIASVSGYFNFNGNLYTKYYNTVSSYYPFRGTANWRGYIEKLSFKDSLSQNTSSDNYHRYIILVPNNEIPDMSSSTASQTAGRAYGVDQTPNDWYTIQTDTSWENNCVEVDGIRRTTYHAGTDGTGVIYDEETNTETNTGDGDASEDGEFNDADTYFIFKLIKLPCGMDASLLKIITM